MWFPPCPVLDQFSENELPTTELLIDAFLLYVNKYFCFHIPWTIFEKKIWKWQSNICWTLNTHCRVWDNFWQLKALEHNEKFFLFYLRNYCRFWEVFIFLSWFFVYVEEGLDKKVMIVFKIHGSTNWRANNCNSCIAQYIQK